MPTYEYACPSCHQVFDVFQSMRDAPLTTCPKCGKEGVKRLIGRGAGIIFKGSGFYETDYKRAAEKKSGAESASTSSSSPAIPASSSSSSSSASSSPAPSSSSTSSSSGSSAPSAPAKP